jgi:hypothetical protein
VFDLLTDDQTRCKQSDHLTNPDGERTAPHVTFKQRGSDWASDWVNYGDVPKYEQRISWDVLLLVLQQCG